MDGADYGGGGGEWLTSGRGHSQSLEVVAQPKSAVSHDVFFFCFLFAPSAREGPTVKYSSVIPRGDGDENKRRSTRLLTEKKREGWWVGWWGGGGGEFPPPPPLQKDLAGGFSHGQGSDCFLNGLLTLLLQ